MCRSRFFAFSLVHAITINGSRKHWTDQLVEKASLGEGTFCEKVSFPPTPIPQKLSMLRFPAPPGGTGKRSASRQRYGARFLRAIPLDELSFGGEREGKPFPKGPPRSPFHIVQKIVLSLVSAFSPRPSALRCLLLLCQFDELSCRVVAKNLTCQSSLIPVQDRQKCLHRSDHFRVAGMFP